MLTIVNGELGTLIVMSKITVITGYVNYYNCLKTVFEELK